MSIFDQEGANKRFFSEEGSSFTINRLEDYLSEVEIELLKKYKKGKIGDNKTLDDIWEQFIATALLIYGDDMGQLIEKEEVIKGLNQLNLKVGYDGSIREKK